MTLEDVKKEIQELAKKSSDSYFKGIMDFFKWTLTICLAALAWIGSKLPTDHQMKWNFMIWSLICIILAIIVSMIIIYYVLEFWNKEWSNNDEHAKWLTKDIEVELRIRTYSPEERADRNKFIQTLVDNIQSKVTPNGFKWGVLIHIGLLSLGLILYAASFGAP